VTDRGVLDTSTLILLGRIADISALPDEPLITAVTLAALSVGPLVARKPAARSYDAMIAAIAVSCGLPVHTCNPGDFRGIDGLEVVPVRQPDRG
jgi:tRNA(fMet)-specific endonuclease VapC